MRSRAPLAVLRAPFRCTGSQEHRLVVLCLEGWQDEGMETSPPGIPPLGAVLAIVVRSRKRLVRRSWELVRPRKGKISI